MNGGDGAQTGLQQEPAVSPCHNQSNEGLGQTGAPSLSLCRVSHFISDNNYHRHYVVTQTNTLKAHETVGQLQHAKLAVVPLNEL